MASRKRSGKNRVVKSKRAISDRHLVLVDCYFAANFNMAEAMRQAGYESGAGYQHRLFNHPDVVAEIERRRQHVARRWELDEDFVIQRLMRLADMNLGAVAQKLKENNYDLMSLTPDERYAIAEIITETKTVRGEERTTTKVKMEPKTASLGLLGKKLNMFTEKVEHVGLTDLVDALHAGRARVAAQKMKADGSPEPA